MNVFVCGIFRKPFLDSVIKNFPLVVGGDRLFILQLSLHSRLLYVDDILFTKIYSTKSIKERYPDEEIGRQWDRKFLNTRFTFYVCKYLITSDIIPSTRKKFVPILIAYKFTLLCKQYFRNLKRRINRMLTPVFRKLNLIPFIQSYRDRRP